MKKRLSDSAVRNLFRLTMNVLGAHAALYVALYGMHWEHEHGRDKDQPRHRGGYFSHSTRADDNQE